MSKTTLDPPPTAAASNPPTHVDDPINWQLLAVSEDQLQGFQPAPFQEIAKRSGIELQTVIARIRAMLEAGVIRRVRQTVMATRLAPGALVAWKVPNDRLTDAFNWMSEHDPFSGHVVIRSTYQATTGSDYKLWTTLKVPVGFSMTKHCELVCRLTGATSFRLMPAHKMFALGVGHVRRRDLAPGMKTEQRGRVIHTDIVELTPEQWQVLAELKREFAVDEIAPEPWRKRAEQAGLDYQAFVDIAAELASRNVLGRFSTFLEHVKRIEGNNGQAVTRYNALFHWRVPEGRELEAGLEVGRFHCMTHAYWREGGPEFGHVNLMGVTHGLEKDAVLAHKQAMDDHLSEVGIDSDYTNVFWGGRSRIKPSEILPAEYERFCAQHGVDPSAMKAEA